MKVLIVDDSPVQREGLREVLEDCGWTVEVAEDGISALGRAARVRPDLVLLDLRMPRMDGLELLSRLRATTHGSATPVIVTTGSDVPDRLPGQVAGVMHKPFAIGSLLGAIERLFPGAAAQEQAQPA